MNRDAKHARHAVHRVSHAPGTRAAREHEHARAADDGRLVRKRRVDGWLVARRHHIAPDGLHVQGVCTHAMVVEQRVAQRVRGQNRLGPGRAGAFVLVLVFHEVKVLERPLPAMARLIIGVIVVEVVEALEDFLALLLKLHVARPSSRSPHALSCPGRCERTPPRRARPTCRADFFASMLGPSYVK